MWPIPQETADLITFTKEILNRKIRFLCIVGYAKKGYLGTTTVLKLILESGLSTNYILCRRKYGT